MSKAHIVIGQGKAGAWSNDASAVEKTDADLRAVAKDRGLLDDGHARGVADRDGNLMGDGWLLVVGSHVHHSDLDADPSVIAYCDAE